MAPTKSKKASKTEKRPSSASSLKQNAKPDWPALTPLVPTGSLCIDTLLPSQILLIRNLFTSTLCARYISFLSSLPLMTTPLPVSRDMAVRVNDRYQVEDAAFAESLWTQTALKDLVLGYKDQAVWGDSRAVGGHQAGPPEILELNPNIRVYRYRAGQFFDKHYDDANDLSFAVGSGQSVAAKTTWTLLIYLSVCEGGETVFYPNKQKRSKVDPEPIAVAPGVGLALLHRHGIQCLIHEGMEVTAGEKWVLRSDLVVKR